MSILANADSLSQLSDTDQAAVARICLPVQYQDGAAAYRQCVLSEVEARGKQDLPASSVLSFDEQYAIQQICQPVASPGDAAYQECVNLQLDGLGQIPVTELSSFDNDDVYALQQDCFDTQLVEGVKAYRQCINGAAAGLQALPRPDLSELTLLERNALQLRCSAQHSVAADYRQCLLDASLVSPTAAIPETTASPVESVEIELEPASTLATDPAPQSAPQSSPLTSPPTTLQSVPLTSPLTSPQSTPRISLDPATVRRNDSSVLTNPDQRANQAANTTTTTAETATAIEPVSLSDTAQPISASSADVATTLPATDQNTADAPKSANEVTEPEIADKSATSMAAQLWNTVQSSVSGLDNMERMIVAAAMALPILLVGFWFLIRGTEREPEAEPNAPGQRNPLIDRISPLQQRRSHPDQADDVPTQPQVDADIHAGTTDRMNLSRQADDMFGEMPANYSRPVNLDDVETLDLSESDRADKNVMAADTSQLASNVDTDHADSNTQRPHEITQITAGEQLSSTERAGFLAWLNQQPHDARQALAIEFLIYWLAYADDRYEPAMKQSIFQIRDPDAHEQIKRWVLMQDVYAFSDVVYWVQRNCSIPQREQILDLLMALLINENALTPVQNTTLRFLSDAFGLGHDQLDARFRQAYGHSMPPLPRADKPRWWHRQPVDLQRRWDARTISLQSRDIQYRVKLGLPLSGELREEDVTASLLRAAARCNPERFNLLGPREQSLAERQFTKFEFAKDCLLEVSA